MLIGVLHPGEMGVSIGQSLLQAGHQVAWCAQGRSTATARRAAPFTRFDTLAELLQAVDGVFSVCPPHAALGLAREVAGLGFDGLYVDANAVSPSTARSVAATVGRRYVDGGIIGPPAHRAGTTRLYLSGARASEVVAWFEGANLGVRVVDDGLTSASALKMAYAAYTKGSSALLLAVNALAEQAGVRQALRDEWALSQPGLEVRSEQTAAGTSRKAWRFVGEMEEIAATFAELGLPDQFHRGAADLYRRMAALKDRPPAELEAVLRQILSGQTRG